MCTLFNFSLTTKLIIAELLWSFPKFVVVQANENNSIFLFAIGIGIGTLSSDFLKDPQFILFFEANNQQ